MKTVNTQPDKEQATIKPTRQRGLIGYCKRHWKLLAISTGLSLLVLWLASFLNPVSTSIGTARVVAPLAAWVEAHRFLFLLWHIVIIAAILVAWGNKVNNALKKGLLQANEAVFIREIRWLLVAAIVAIDYFLLR